MFAASPLHTSTLNLTSKQRGFAALPTSTQSRNHFRLKGKQLNFQDVLQTIRNLDKFARSDFNHLVSADELELESKSNSKLASFNYSSKQPKAVFDAYEMFDNMTMKTYNSLLKELCYVGRVEEAYELLMNTMIKPKPELEPDIYTYTILMDGFCKVGRSNEALELLDQALAKGLTPTAATYNTLFNGYFKEGRPLDGISLLQQMKDRNCQPDYIIYSTLLHGLLKWGQTKPALGMYKDMVALGFRVDVRMTNTLMRLLCRHSKLHVGELFEKMKNNEYAIYSCTYDLVIQAFCSTKENAKAFETLDEMITSGYSPRTTTFSAVIHALCMDGEVDKALSTLMLIHKDRKASKIPFNTLINELQRRGRPLNASVVYGLAVKRGVVPQKEPKRLKHVRSSNRL